MSNYIPFEIQTEIIKGFPVKSLIRFKSVSKQWKSLIDSSEFIADHTTRHHLQTHQQRQHLLLGYIDTTDDYKQKYLSIIDDDNNFARQKVSINFPGSFKKHNQPSIAGSSHGLICLFGCSFMAVIWNPLINKSVSVDVPNVVNHDTTCVGFGVCPKTLDPKIVKINPVRRYGSVPWRSPCDIEVFTLSSGVWRSPLTNLPSVLFDIKWSKNPVVIDGFIYWFVRQFSHCGMFIMISFDLTTEEFKPVYFPESFALGDSIVCLFLYKPRNSPAVLKYRTMENRNLVYEVWIMDNSVSRSFTNLYTISIPHSPIWVYRDVLLQCRKNGQLIMVKTDDSELVLYDPCSKQLKQSRNLWNN